MTPKTKYALLAVSLFLGLSGLTWWLYRRFFRDGLGPPDSGTTKAAPPNNRIPLPGRNSVMSNRPSL